MKRVATLFIAIFLVISIIPLKNAFAAEAVTQPMVVSLSIDKNEVTAGDTIKVRLKVSDSTGINYINLYYPSPISGKNITVSLNYNRDLDVFEGSIPVDNSFESGQYLPNMISFYDSTGSISTIYQSDFQDQVQGAAFTVSGTTGSNIIESIQMDKKEVIPGDTVKVSVKTVDHTGINEINLFYITPVSNSGIYVSLYYNSETNAYEGNIPINSTTESGQFSLNMLSIYGSDNNVTSMYRSQNDQLFQTGDFVVSGTSGEDVIDSVSLVKQAVTAGDLVKISVKAKDNTGISYMNVYYTSPISQKSFTIDLSYNSETDSYEGSFPIQKDSEVGTYNLYMLGIYDTSGNTMALYRSYYDSKFKNGDFAVFTESNPPSFKSLSIDKTTVEPGDTLNITVDGTDDTNLLSAAITYTTPISQAKKTISLSYDGQHFVGQLPIDSNTEVGKWTVDSVEITDTNGNSTLIKADGTDLTAGIFTVLPSQPAKPVVNDVTDKDTSITGQAEAGANVEAKVNGTVIGSGTADANGQFSLTISAQTADLELDITATDKAGNVSEATTTVVKDATPPVKPAVNDVTDKNTSITGQAEAGAEIEVKGNGSVIGSGSASNDGMFSISIPIQPAGTGLVVTAIDHAGNVSEEAKVSVINAKPSGWVQDKGNWYYFDPTTGDNKTGWFKYGSSWYFFNENGSMQTGWVKMGTSWYYLKDNGIMQTGWVKMGTTWYYLKNNGIMQTGWVKIGTSWYYLNSSGIMVTGKTKISGKWYVFNNNGSLK